MLLSIVVSPTIVTAIEFDVSLFDIFKTVPLSVEDKIRLAAQKYGVDEQLALNIACVESGFSATAKNPTSTASGVFQFIDSTWRHAGLKYWGSLEGRDKLNADDNIELALLILRDSGTSDWNASKFSGANGGWMADPVGRGLCL